MTQTLTQMADTASQEPTSKCDLARSCNRQCPYTNQMIPLADVRNYGAGHVCPQAYEIWAATED